MSDVNYFCRSGAEEPGQHADHGRDVTELPAISLHECIASMGFPTSATGIPVRVAVIGPIVDPHTKSLRDTNCWSGTSHSRHSATKAAAVPGSVAYDWFTFVLSTGPYTPTANFAGQNHQIYLGLGSFGTGALYIDEDSNSPGLRYRAIHLGEIYFFENHQGVVDKAKRKFKLSARQCAQQFGEDILPSDIKSVYGTSDQDKPRFDILHCVSAREYREPGRLDYCGKAYASYYIALSSKTLLRESGYNTFPYAIARHTLYPGEVYGRSPAMEALPAIKTINEQKKTMIRQGQRVVDPVFLAFHDGVIDGFSLKSGAINAGGVNRDGRPLVHALPTGNLVAGEKMMELERIHIRDAFLTTLFQILRDRPQATATEGSPRTTPPR